MDPPEEPSTTNEGSDHYGVVVRLKADFGTFGTEILAHTQSDVVPIFSGMETPYFPSKVAVYVRKLTTTTLKQLTTEPSKFPRAANSRLFARFQKHRPDGMRVAALMSTSTHPYDPALDALYVRAHAGVKAEVLGLPADMNDTPTSIMARLRKAEAVRQTLAPNERKIHAAMVRLDSKRAIPITRRLVDAGAKLIIFEFHGSGEGARATLAVIHGILAKAKSPPYCIGINVPRMAKPDYASGVLWAVAYGMQVCAMQTGQWFPNDEEDLSKLRWLVRAEGGYKMAKDLKRPWTGECTCPDAPNHFAADDKHAALPARKRHEIWGLLAECEEVTNAIRTENFRGYLARRQLLRAALPGWF